MILAKISHYLVDRIDSDSFLKFGVEILNHLRLFRRIDLSFGHELVDKCPHLLGDIQSRFLFKLIAQVVSEFVTNLEIKQNLAINERISMECPS